MKTTVEQIHAEVDSAQHRLLEEAQSIIAGSNINFNKMDRLLALGFTSSSEVVENQEKHLALVSSKAQAELISHYMQIYPFLKFLTEQELNRICEKYNLIHAPVKNYIKFVPEKNLKEIEGSQELQESDVFPAKLMITELRSNPSSVTVGAKGRHHIFEKWATNYSFNQQMNTEQLKSFYLSLNIGGLDGVNVYAGLSTWGRIDMSGLFIAAPKSHLDLKDLSQKTKHGFFHVEKIEPKDPIVFRYCRGGIQVLTKWGEEAEDPSLIVPLNN